MLEVYKPSASRSDPKVKVIYDRKEAKYMSYMIALTNNNKTVIATDSRVMFPNGQYRDNAKKLYINKEKNILLGFIGPYEMIEEQVKYNIPELISNEIFNGKNIEEALLQKINGTTLKQLLRKHFRGKVLTIFKAEKQGKLTGFDFKINENSYIFYEDEVRLVNGDFNHDFALSMLYEPTILVCKSDAEIKEKVEKVMALIISAKEENSEANCSTSTIGGEIQIEMI